MLDKIDDVKNLITKHKDGLITILDDTDLDGLAGAIIVYNYLKYIGCSKIIIIPNKTHGVSNIADSLITNLLIVIDSSTNECKFVSNKNYDVIIIDHHIKTELPITNTLNTIININARDYKEYYNYSSAMLSYEIFINLYGELPNNKDLHYLAYATYYSDMIDIDDYISAFIKNFEYRYSITDNSFHRSLASSLNKIRKLSNEEDILSLFFYDGFTLLDSPSTVELITQQSNSVSYLYRFIKDKVNGNKPKYITQFGSNIECIDLTTFIPFTKDNTLLKIKGTLASILSTKPITFSTVKIGIENNITRYAISCRSKYPILSMLNKISKDFCEKELFSGHQNSFGGEMDEVELIFILGLLEDELNVHNFIDNQFYPIQDKPLEELAYYNLRKNKDIRYCKIMTGKELKELQNIYNIKSQFPIEDDKQYYIEPTRRC